MADCLCLIGTSGGIGGPTTTVASLAALKTAVSDDVPRIVWVSGAYNIQLRSSPALKS